MIYGGDNVEFELAVRCGLEDTRIDLDLFDTRAIEFFEGCDDARFLACSRRAVYEEMREVAALCLACNVLGASHMHARCCCEISY